MSLQEFLDSVQNPNTKKGYRHGIKKFCEWYGKSAEEILEMRKDDLTQTAGENLIEYKNELLFGLCVREGLSLPLLIHSQRSFSTLQKHK